MKKLMVLAAAMVITVSTSMAQHYDKNATARNGKVYTEKSNNNRGRVLNGRSTRGINSFQKEAREHIAYGIIDGTITSNEARRLLEFSERIEIKENRFSRNGRLSSYEMRILKEDLNDLDKMIRRDLRDRERSIADVRNRNHDRRYQR
ncbi:MAG: hypothetical protein ACI9IP_000339 [Arcticibacterium sp.]|jgi:hypothetical protein